MLKSGMWAAEKSGFIVELNIADDNYSKPFLSIKNEKTDFFNQNVDIEKMLSFEGEIHYREEFKNKVFLYLREEPNGEILFSYIDEGMNVKSHFLKLNKVV